mmetsp:Transcript_24801/g.50373  ORF Transcript_24801/g.50373 Transcript_24801/m.50373 type:complete len:142 (+) Transcript_24801:450-875(+)
MYCIAEPWRRAFSNSKCLHAWAKIGLSPFHQRPYWELKTKEEGREVKHEEIKNGVTKLDWAEIAGVRRGADLDLAALNERVHANGRRKRYCSANYWDKSRGFEEARRSVRERSSRRRSSVCSSAMAVQSRNGVMQRQWWRS